jgi:hypothetical protein
MNIFYLDNDPKIAAKMHCDKLNEFYDSEPILKITNKKSKFSKWVFWHDFNSKDFNRIFEFYSSHDDYTCLPFTK